MIARLLTAAALLAVLPTAAQAAVCATPEQVKNIRGYYEKLRPGVPLPVPSRYFNVPESVIPSALPTDQAVGTAVMPEIADQVWKSIDAWGPRTQVSLVFAPNSKNSFAIPSLVPITQNDSSDGYLDVYADDGKGIHSHIQIADVAHIYAHDIPNGDNKNRTRGVSFYGQTGDLIMGVYASIKADPFDPKAVEGFGRTWNLLKAMKRPC
ncbi:ChuX/HutX family heme-like substrate-binding protein [Sphingoaurantiacus capsulatus]|uniref:ChuX/HutX family heme-like substrate-binding protein n=1 Tax=Sphingoaurantiacus capsulatus TaxID=1771310 RepID=A0ABV7XAX4_9SPHN